MLGEYLNKIINADCMEVLKKRPDNSIDFLVMSPFSVELINPIISSITAKVVLDPLMGSGTNRICTSYKRHLYAVQTASVWGTNADL